MKLITGAKFLVLSLLAISVLSTNAATCNEESQNHASDGDEYYNLKGYIALTYAQKAAMRKVANLMEGSWNGQGIERDCWGSVSNTREVNEDVKLKAQITRFSGGELVISWAVKNGKKNKTTHTTLEYFGPKNEYQISEITDNGFTIMRKARQATRGGRAPFSEEITDFKLDGNSLTVQTVKYLNGYFAFQQEYQLYR